jgi:polar amino acid transport system permease protein
MNLLQQILDFLQNVVTLRDTFRWDYVGQYLFAPAIVQGAVLVIILAIISQVLGTLIGLLLYFARRARNGVIAGIANVYIWFFRGTPLLVQLIMIALLFPLFNLATPLRSIDPFSAIGFTHYTPIFLDLFFAAIIGFSLNEGAYMAEIVRAGIDAVDIGQLEAARSLGMTYPLAMRRIVLPQAFRVIVPPLGNEFNNMLKNTSLATAIALPEMLAAAKDIGGALFASLELYFVVALWYLLMTTIWGVIQAYIERRLNASNLDSELQARIPWLKRMMGSRNNVPALGPVAVNHEEVGRRV